VFDQKPRPPRPGEDLAHLTITQARVGDALSILGAGPEYEDIDFTVDRLDQMESGSRRWIQLSGGWRNRSVYLEVHTDPVPEVFGYFDGRLTTLDELGLSEDDLAEMDSRQNQSDFFDYGGKFWLYRSSREIGIFRFPAASGQGFYCWTFQEQDSQRFLSIRKFKGEPFAASLWVKIEPSDITVYRGT
jgi:hypothetical protein